MITRLSIILFLLFLNGCSSLPLDYPRQPSTAYKSPETTKVAGIFKQELAINQGKSGCILLVDGEQAFHARKAMIDTAEHTLDMQYYIWEPDTSGKILIHSLLQAADRGVRVRLLLDDYGSSGLGDINMALLEAHPNVQVRLYNPYTRRNLKGLEIIFNLDRMNHRMHNKTFVMDNAMAIVGGRNIADTYFNVNAKENFRDLDVATIGPVVKEVSSSFDSFWNGVSSIPVAALREIPQQAEYNAARKKLEAWYDSQTDFPYSIDRGEIETRQRLVELKPKFIWAHAKVLADEPDKPVTKDESKIIREVRQLIKDIEYELLIENAYFIPQARGVTTLAEMKKRGINVRVLTNSLASNDLLPSHAAYSQYRKDLLEAGIELYELRPDASTVVNDRKTKGHSSISSLHTKSMVFDRRSVIIGTMNLGPRSIHLNTEVVLYIENEALARQVAEYLDVGVMPENSYQLKLRDTNLDKDGIDREQEIMWVTEVDGKPVVYSSDPESGLFQKIGIFFINLLPIEDYL